MVQDCHKSEKSQGIEFQTIQKSGKSRDFILGSGSLKFLQKSGNFVWAMAVFIYKYNNLILYIKL